jgi:hypothetical protein
MSRDYPRHSTALTDSTSDCVCLGWGWETGQGNKKEPEFGIAIHSFFFHSFVHFTTAFQQGLLYDKIEKVVSLSDRTSKTMTVELGMMVHACNPSFLGGSN